MRRCMSMKDSVDIFVCDRAVASMREPAGAGRLASTAIPARPGRTAPHCREYFFLDSFVGSLSTREFPALTSQCGTSQRFARTTRILRSGTRLLQLGPGLDAANAPAGTSTSPRSSAATLCFDPEVSALAAPVFVDRSAPCVRSSPSPRVVCVRASASGPQWSRGPVRSRLQQRHRRAAPAAQTNAVRTGGAARRSPIALNERAALVASRARGVPRACRRLRQLRLRGRRDDPFCADPRPRQRHGQRAKTLSLPVQVQDARVGDKTVGPTGAPFTATLDLRRPLPTSAARRRPSRCALGRRSSAFGEQRLVGHLAGSTRRGRSMRRA